MDKDNNTDDLLLSDIDKLQIDEVLEYYDELICGVPCSATDAYDYTTK